MQIGAKRAKTRMQRVDIPTELPFCTPLFAGWVCSGVSVNRKKNSLDHRKNWYHK